MVEIHMNTKANGVRRQVYARDVAGKVAPGTVSGIPRCDAIGCVELVRFHSTDGFCIRHWALSKTQTVKRKSVSIQEGRRKRRKSPHKLDATARAVIALANKRPGITMGDIVSQVKHPYATNACASASIAQKIRRGTIAGLRIEHEGRLLKVYPADKKKNER